MEWKLFADHVMRHPGCGAHDVRTGGLGDESSSSFAFGTDNVTVSLNWSASSCSSG